MTSERPKELESFVDRIIAPTREDETRAFEFFHQLFADNDLLKFEKRKTSEEIEMIELINENFSEFLKSYEVNRTKRMPPEKIHIMDESQLNDAQKQTLRALPFQGRYSPEDQDIIIIPSDSEPYNIKTIVHEMLHAQSFLSFDVLPRSVDSDPDKLSPRRIGFNVYNERARDQMVAAFHAIDEAIIEELSKRFYFSHVTTMPNMKNVLQNVAERKANGGADDDEIIDWQSKQLPDGTWQSTAWFFGYQKERDDLWDLIDDIFTHDTSKKFQSHEDIFKLFVRAQMTGRLLPLARVIRRVYGKGSFKFLGEVTKNIKALN